MKLATGGDTWTRTAALGAIEQMGTSVRTVGEARVLWAKAGFSSAVGTVQSGAYRISNQPDLPATQTAAPPNHPNPVRSPSLEW